MTIALRRRADVPIHTTTAGNYNGGGVQYIVQTTTGDLYVIFIDSGSDVVYRKSIDGGLTWQPDVNIYTGTTTGLSVWYDRWSNISAGLIHLAYMESATDDVFYRTINTESSDALSTQTTIIALTSTAYPSIISICRARGGNVYCGVYIDVGAEGGFYRLPNANVPNGAWDAARATIGEGDTTAPGDHWVLMPGWAADNQDMMAFYWDESASEISRKLYDDSANSWAETSIAASMTILTPGSGFAQLAGAVDISNSRNLLVAWSAADTLNADLRCWHITESAITEVTNVVQNSTDDQGFCAISIDTIRGGWCVFYGGASAGGETFNTAMNVYAKCSMDSGSTWGPETKLTESAMSVWQLSAIPRVLVSTSTPPPVLMYTAGGVLPDMRINVDRTTPNARTMIGL